MVAMQSKRQVIQIKVGWMQLRPRFESQSRSLKTRNSLTAIQIAGRCLACEAAYNVEPGAAVSYFYSHKFMIWPDGLACVVASCRCWWWMFVVVLYLIVLDCKAYLAANERRICKDSPILHFYYIFFYNVLS